MFQWKARLTALLVVAAVIASALGFDLGELDHGSFNW